MNAAEHFFCSSSLWRYFTQRMVLPWVISATPLGDHVLEIGAGYGAATAFLRQRASRVTSLEYDHRSARQLKLRHDADSGGAVCGDASRLPFADQTFSSALAILVLHHLKSAETQDQMLAEVFRVLRPGGVFLAFEITDGWINRLVHIRSTFTPIAPASASQRLTAAGFSGITFDLRGGTFRLNATRSSAPSSNARLSS
jgi:ubiquinone/menaquinone biosynthesis C-methylase UbiE